MSAPAKRFRKFNEAGEMEYSKLLIDEKPLQVLPGLAVLIGLNEAIVLQQLHYWLGKSKNELDGHQWVYNSYEQWQAQDFPFWHVNTIQRLFGGLEKQGIVLSRRMEAQGWNQRKWYTIDYAVLDEMARSNAA